MLKLCATPTHSPAAYAVLAEIVRIATAPASMRPSAKTVPAGPPATLRERVREAGAGEALDAATVVDQQHGSGDQRADPEDRGQHRAERGVIAAVA